jgi:glycosyltransferase involved in cell wall biosynthesis
VRSPGDKRAPRVTIVIPTYNRAGPLLEQAIESVLGQDYPELDLLVLDDGSSDETPSLLERYAERHPGRFRSDRHDNIGQAKTLNRGYEMAQGELLGYLNSDDVLLPGAISKLVAAMEANPDAVLAYPAYRIIDEEGETHLTMTPPRWSVAEALRLHNCIVNVGAIFRREVFERIGGWDPSLIYCADFDWCIRAGAVGPFVRVDEPLACWRFHEGSANAAPGLGGAREQLELLDKVYAADDVPEELLEVRDEAYRNAYIVAGFAIGGTNEPLERFFVHDNLMQKMSARDEHTAVAIASRQREELEQAKLTEEELRATVERLQASLRESNQELRRLRRGTGAGARSRQPASPWRRAAARAVPTRLRPSRRAEGANARDGNARPAGGGPDTPSRPKPDNGVPAEAWEERTRGAEAELAVTRWELKVSREAHIEVIRALIDLQRDPDRSG